MAGERKDHGGYVAGRILCLRLPVRAKVDEPCTCVYACVTRVVALSRSCL